jgi:1-deoxy-D-xylulose-5-phosphate synthase
MLTPSDENECRLALTTAFRQDHPVAVRYPRGTGVGVAIDPTLGEWPWGKGVIRRESPARVDPRGGKRIAILAFGTVLHAALKAADSLGATVADMRFAKPLDEALVLELARSHDSLVTVEEGCVMGGAGSAVLECLAAHGMAVPVLQLGLPDQFVEHGDPAKLLALCGLDAAGIEKSIVQRFGSRPALAAVNS